MKLKIFVFLFSLAMGQALSAQSGVPATATSDAEVRKTTEALTSKYSLTPDQAKQMYQVQLRKNRQMGEIAAFQSSDPALYRGKQGSIQKGTWDGIRRILNNKPQMDIFRKTQTELQGLRNAKRKEMVQQKASKDLMESAVLAIYAE